MAASEPSVIPLDRPLRFRRVCLEKVWGGRALERTPGIELDVEGPVGETWELVDRDDQNSVVLDGPLEGRTLRSLMEEAGAELLGTAHPGPGGRFPLLVKYISASRPLSVQVHPDDATAARLEADEAGKTECWYVLAAGEKSVVYLGLAPEVDMSDFAAKARGASIVDLLQAHPISAGQFVFVPAGTLHAIGEDVTLLEVQQNSDVTYRLYDWGRVGLDGKPRETHCDKGLLAIHYDEHPKPPFTPELEERGVGNRGAQLVDCEHFGVELLRLSCSVESDTEGRALVYACTGGAGRLTLPGVEGEWELRAGDTWLLPAAVGAHRLEAGNDDVTLLRVETRG